MSDKNDQLDEMVMESNAICEMWMKRHRDTLSELIYENPTRDPKELQIEFLEAKLCMIISWMTMMFQGDYEKVRRLISAMVDEEPFDEKII
tara:strand:+ start:32 stop:304 length:273 start_codon:yes stop_codon:yes gene_type:complete